MSSAIFDPDYVNHSGYTVWRWVDRSVEAGAEMRIARQVTLAIVVVGATIAVCSSGQFVQTPALMRFVAPSYPSGVNAAPSEKVTAIVTVNTDGTVRDVTIKHSAGTPLEEAVVKAVRKWYSFLL